MSELAAFVVGFIVAWMLRHWWDIHALKTWIAENRTTQPPPPA